MWEKTELYFLSAGRYLQICFTRRRTGHRPSLRQGARTPCVLEEERSLEDPWRIWGSSLWLITAVVLVTGWLRWEGPLEVHPLCWGRTTWSWLPRTVITEWFELEGSLALIQFQPPRHGQGYHLITRSGCSGPIPPGLEHFQG